MLLQPSVFLTPNNMIDFFIFGNRETKDSSSNSETTSRNLIDKVCYLYIMFIALLLSVVCTYEKFRTHIFFNYYYTRQLSLKGKTTYLVLISNMNYYFSHFLVKIETLITNVLQTEQI